MNRALRSRRLRALAVAGALLAASQPWPLTPLDAQASQSMAAVERLFAAPPDEARIMMRWWWFGPSTTRAEIESEIQRMKDGGIGGFEIATVYPMAPWIRNDGERPKPTPPL